ncbi:MAG: tetratricopeptide repeat protein, partial [Bacteroidota bacterium]
DAFAPILFSSNSNPLQTTAPEQAQQGAPKIDFSVFLPLPQLSFGFYGRRKEYREIRDGLLYKNHRAVIVHGIGGIGKTALISNTALRLRKSFRGVYAFDCTRAALAPETILLNLHSYIEALKINALKELIHQQPPPDVAANYLGDVLRQWPMLVIFDNFETHLRLNEAGTHEVADPDLAVFLRTLLNTTKQGTHFLFTTRYLFDIDAKRLGTIHELPLNDLSRPEALGLMQKLPHLSKASYEENLQVFQIFGGHPYALVTLDRHLGQSSLEDVLRDTSSLKTELREFLAIELNYSKLTPRSQDLLNRLAAFRVAVPASATEWVLGDKVDMRDEVVKLVAQKGVPKGVEPEQVINELLNTLPEKRKAENLAMNIHDLIAWGLLTPIEDDGEVHSFAVHSLVRNFCRSKLDVAAWKHRLLDAAAFYTNRAKSDVGDDNAETTVWEQIEAFELLWDAQEFEDAASILINANPYLDRWGFGRYLEGLYRRLHPKLGRGTEARVIHNLGILIQARGEYAEALAQYEKSLKIKEELGDRAGVAGSLHQIGIIHQDRGEYAEALAQYEKSLKIKEELGDRAGVATSLGQLGQLSAQTKSYAEAFKYFLSALAAFSEIHSPYASLAIKDLQKLRGAWGEDNFDKAWKEKTGKDVPEELKSPAKDSPEQ